VKTLHLVYSFPPDAPGGTEVYVAGLCRRLREQGVEAVVAAPAVHPAQYEFQGMRVVRYERQEGTLDLEALYGVGDRVALEAFERVFESERPDLVHLHALTAACPAELARRIKARGVPVVFTYHTPTVTCQRGTLLRWGAEVCDGVVEPFRCAACTLQQLGGRRWVAKLTALVPEAAGEFLGRRRLAGGIWTAARMRSLMMHRKRELTKLFDACDRIIAPVGWVEEVLLANGAAPEKIVRSHHGVDTPARAGAGHVRDDDRPLRVAHLARLDPAKGTALLVQALRDAPSIHLELDIYAVAQDPSGVEYGAHLRALAGTDRRIRFRPAVDPATVIERLQPYDVVAVPSQVVETGPLVVLEALAAGVPVLGSALGGLREYVRDGVDGVLVAPHGSVEAWRRALMTCAADRNLVAGFRAAVRPPRTMTEVAQEMAILYRDVIALDARAGQALVAVALPA
jgi:glycosyltransferase involved in cell wall biosynthesis